jgi:hypothetical protein
MRKLTFVVAALIALTATSYAVAHGIEGAKNAKAVAGTFTATAGSTTSRTCTTADNKTIVVTDAKYTGAATGDADLTGPITLRARSVVNTTDGVGTVTGSLKIDAAGKNTQAGYSAVYDHGNIAGLAAGRAHESNTALVANISAGFDPATGFTSGKIGGGTAGGSAVEVGGGGCKPAKQTHEKSSARGTISALSSSSITVAGLTCAIPSDKSAAIQAKFKVNDAVEIRCAFANGANTLTSISGKHH